MANLNWVDYIIISIFALSILAGLLRGLVKEMISLLTWASAMIIASVLAERVANLFTRAKTGLPSSTTLGVQASKSVSLLAIGISFVALFVIILIIGALINYFVSRAIDAQGISIGNRLLGGSFGLIRGFLINLVMILLVQLSPIAKQFDWMHSEFVQSFQPVVRLIEKWIEPQLLNLKSSVNQQIETTKRFSEYLSKSFF